MIYSHQSGDSPLKFSLGGGGAYFTVQELAEPGDAETWFLGAAGEAEVERRLIKRIPIVVYHVAAMGDWQDVVREQLRLIRDVGLGAEVRCTHVGGGLDWLLAEAKACDVNLVIVRSDPNTDHYETFAILEIERLARVENTDRNILYMHTKGVSAPGHAGKHSWRRAMEEYVVRLWRRNVETLGDGSGYDAIGLNWQQHSQQHFSGNFWIARPDWIRRLPDFVTYHHALQCVRYSCEFWIGAMEWCRAYSLACADIPGWHASDRAAEYFPPPAGVDGAVRLNLGCQAFYMRNWTNIDLSREFKADIYEDAITLPSFGSASVDEIYAGHLAEHLVDVEAAFRRWHEVLKPGGIITITVPDGVGVTEMWRHGREFLGGVDMGVLGVATGYRNRAESDADVQGLQAHRRLWDRSTLMLCLSACGFKNLREVDNHPIMVMPCCRLGWQLAVEATA